jgi:uncharacterized membrane protein YbhN (UPF0104 family)
VRLVNNAAETVEPKPAIADELPPPRRGYGPFAIRLGLGVIVLAVLLWRFDVAPVFRSLARERLAFFAGSVALYLASQVMSTFRWQLLTRLNGIAAPFREHLTYYFIGMFTNLFVPGLVGGDAARALYLGRRHDCTGEAIASVIADRGIGLVALFWFAAAGALVISGVPLPRPLIRTTVAIGLVSFLGYVMAPLLVIPARNFRGRLGKVVAPVIPYLRRPVALIPAIILSLVLQASLAACQYILARGIGLETRLATFMFLVPIANVAASLPITINGLGVREAAYLVLFGIAGVGKHDAIALSLLWFASTALGGLSGIVAFVTTEVPRSVDRTPGPRQKIFSSTEMLQP